MNLRTVPLVCALSLVCCGPLAAGEGMVLYTRNGSSIWRAGKIRVATLDASGKVQSDTEIYSGLAHEPKFSPDGKRIAFVRDSDKKLLVIDADGGNAQVLASTGGGTYPLGSWRHADSIYVNGGSSLLRYDFQTGKTTVVLTAAGSQKFRELDISRNLRGLYGGMPPIYRFDLKSGANGNSNVSRCGASISPDGTRITNCRSDHAGFYLREWGTWTIKKNVNTPTSREALDPQFSGNSNDHILVNIGSLKSWANSWLYEISAGKWTQVTFGTGGVNSASDFYLGKPAAPTPANTAPAATIVKPSAGAAFETGASIAYSGSATDAEDGALGGTSLVWTYDIDGDAKGRFSLGTGTGGSFSAPVHPQGTTPYTLTLYLTATDSAGKSGETSAKVTINSKAASNTAPSVDAGGDATAELGSGAFLLGTATDDGLPGGPVTVTWSQVSGPGTVTFAEKNNLSTNASFSRPGDYVLRLTASDGQLQSSDEVRVTVAQPPAITITSPAGGEAWPAGTIQAIRWTVVNLNDVTIRYSTDGGKSWAMVAATLDTASPQWGNYPWRVPNTLSTQSLILIEGYKGEAPETSRVFEITSGGPDETAPVVRAVRLGLSGLVNDAGLSTVKVGGTDVPVTSGTFSGEATLTGTTTNVNVVATDAAGNTATRALQIQ